MPGLADIVTGIIGGVGNAAVQIRTAITGVDPATAGKLQELAAQLEAQQAQAERRRPLSTKQKPLQPIGLSPRGVLRWVGCAPSLLLYSFSFFRLRKGWYRCWDQRSCPTGRWFPSLCS
jgi:hypothetical protein